MIRFVAWKHGDQVDATGELIEIARSSTTPNRFVGLILRPDGTFCEYEMIDLIVTHEFNSHGELERMPTKQEPVVPAPPAPTFKVSKSLLDRK